MPVRVRPAHRWICSSRAPEHDHGFVRQEVQNGGHNIFDSHAVDARDGGATSDAIVHVPLTSPALAAGWPYITPTKLRNTTRRGQKSRCVAFLHHGLARAITHWNPSALCKPATASPRDLRIGC